MTKSFLQKRYPNHGITESISNVHLNIPQDEVLKKRIDKIINSDLSHPILGQAVNSIDVKYKGEHLIIRAMKKLLERGIIAEFQIVGPGNGTFLLAEAEKNGVKDHIKLMGTLQKEEILRWYETLDVYVQPSKQEGLPRSVIEAMSVGCPALGSDIAGIPELLEPECLFNPKNIKEIADKIALVLDKKKLLYQAKRNFNLAKKYSIEEINKRRYSVFRQYANYCSNIENIKSHTSTNREYEKH